MIGVDATNGKILGGTDHLLQSIRDILSTRVGSRVMRRDYGSDIPALVDSPINRESLLKIYAAGVTAIAKWEPRFQAKKIKAVSSSPGSVTLDLDGIYLPDGVRVSLRGVTINAG